jgi:hypothetical protein
MHVAGGAELRAAGATGAGAGGAVAEAAAVADAAAVAGRGVGDGGAGALVGRAAREHRDDDGRGDSHGRLYELLRLGRRARAARCLAIGRAPLPRAGGTRQRGPLPMRSRRPALIRASRASSWWAGSQ